MKSTNPPTDLAERLRDAGLRPTRQRLELGRLLFDGPSRHVTAERLFDQACAAGTKVSLATVYNTLNQFRDAGLLAQVLVGDRGWFDTNTTHHHHLFCEDTGELTDLPPGAVQLPTLPDGTELRGIDLVVRVGRCPGASGAA
jgi:Fur family iron response transcriptional regulator